MAEVLRKAWNVFTWFLICVFVALAVLLVGVRFVGLQPYIVLSGSMEPTYRVGAMIYVKPVEFDELKVGDPVTFYLNDRTVATHRIVEIVVDDENPNEKYVRTQGDANDTPDSDPTHHSKIIGKPLFSVPYLGFLSSYLQQPQGRKAALIACVGLIVAFVLPDAVRGVIKAIVKDD